MFIRILKIWMVINMFAEEERDKTLGESGRG